MPTLNFLTVRFRDVAGIRRRNIGIYTGPVSYTTGGDPFAAQDVALATIEFLDVEPARNAAYLQRSLIYDYTLGKIVWIDPTTGAEIAAATNLSTFTARFEAVGK